MPDSPGSAYPEDLTVPGVQWWSGVSRSPVALTWGSSSSRSPTTLDAQEFQGLVAPGAHQPWDPAVLCTQQPQSLAVLVVQLSCSSGSSTCQQSWVSNSPWTSLLGARDPQEPSSACSGRAMGVPEQGQMDLQAATG